MATEWEVVGHYIMACNCDFGCPCNFNAPPTPGFCEGVVGFAISSGTYGNTDLSGANVAAVVKWPGAIHEGGGKGALFIDRSATDDQRQALERIVSGDEGGTFGMIMKNTVDHIDGPHYVDFDVRIAGKDSFLAVGDQARIVFDSIRNAVTGAESFPRVVLPQGVWSNELEQYTTKEFAAGDGDLGMDHTGKVAQLAKIHWRGP